MEEVVGTWKYWGYRQTESLCGGGQGHPGSQESLTDNLSQ